jgi:hypothetical protein
MHFLEEDIQVTKNNNTNLLYAPLLKKQTTTKKLKEGKRMTDGLHDCVEGHHVVQFVLDLIKKTRENKDKEA